MSKISSATSLTLTAYLTEKGRDYLAGFNGNSSNRIVDGTDMFKPTKFTLYDSDVNYRVSDKLTTGDPTDLAGNKGDNCLSTIANQVKKNILIYEEGNTPTISFESDLYVIDEGQAVSFPTLLSHLQFGFINKSVDISIDEVRSTLAPNQYSIDNTPSTFTYEGSIQEFTSNFTSTTDEEFLIGETRDVVLTLSNFVEAEPGEITETTIRINGTAPLEIPINFDRLEDSVRTGYDGQHGNIVINNGLLTEPSFANATENYMEIEISDNLIPYIDLLNIKIIESDVLAESNRPIILVDRHTVSSMIRNGERVPFEMLEGDDSFAIDTRISTIDSIDSSFRGSITFRIVEAGEGISVGVRDTYVINVEGVDQPVIPECVPAVFEDPMFDEGNYRWAHTVNAHIPSYIENLDNNNQAVLAVESFDQWQDSTNGVSMAFGGPLSEYDRSDIPGEVSLQERWKLIDPEKNIDSDSGIYSKILFENGGSLSGDYIAKISIRAYTAGNPRDILRRPRVYIVAGYNNSDFEIKAEQNFDVENGVTDSGVPDFINIELPITLDGESYFGFFVKAIDGATAEGASGVRLPAFGYEECLNEPDRELRDVPQGQIWACTKEFGGTIEFATNVEVDSFQVICP